MGAFGIAADAHDAGLVVLRVAMGDFLITADTHDAGLVMLGVALVSVESRLMLMMLGLLCWEWPLPLDSQLMHMMLRLVALGVACGLFGVAADAHNAGLVV